MSKRRIITLVRHGETHGNVEDRAQGHYDSELNQTGLQQAEHLAHRLAKNHFTAAYSSDSQRARMTIAPLIAIKPELAVSYRSELREMCYGDYENTPWSEIFDRDPDLFRLWIDWNTRPDAKFPNGESDRDMWRRVGAFAEVILDTHDAPHENILIVTHGEPARTLLAQLLKLRISDLWRFAIDNASVTVLMEHPFTPSRWRVHLLNDTHHLNGIAHTDRSIP